MDYQAKRALLKCYMLAQSGGTEEANIDLSIRRFYPQDVDDELAFFRNLDAQSTVAGALTRAEPRRFTGAPITGFGALS